MSKSEHLHEHLRRENYNKPGERKTGSEDFLHFGREAGILIIMRDLWSACLSSNRAVLLAEVDEINGVWGKILQFGFQTNIIVANPWELEKKIGLQYESNENIYILNSKTGIILYQSVLCVSLLNTFCQQASRDHCNGVLFR